MLDCRLAEVFYNEVWHAHAICFQITKLQLVIYFFGLSLFLWYMYLCHKVN